MSATSERERIELGLEGMTCAACATRIEKRLNELDGVEASVNYATEHAVVVFDPVLVTPDRLASEVQRIGYRAHLPQEEPGPPRPPPDRADDLRRRMIVAVALSVPVLALSMVPALQFDRWQWLALQLATPVVAWCGWPFHRAAWANLRHGAATMDTLVSLGALAAYGWSVVALFVLGAGREGMHMAFHLAPRAGQGAHDVYLEVACGVVTFMLVGRYLEARAKHSSGAALRALLELGAKDVAVLEPDGGERRVPVDRLAVGDRFVVRPGERLAADGRVVAGAASVDRSLLTGESAAVAVGEGDDVEGSTLNLDGRLVVVAVRVGSDTAVAQIGQLVADAQSGKAAAQRLADRVAGVFVPAILAVAAATLAYWLATGSDFAYAAACAVAVVIVACPCALGLATPTALLVGTGRGAQLGIVIRGPEVLEATRAIDTVVLDKTGTVTSGEMTLAAVVPADGEDAAQALWRAAAVGHASEHPVARAIAAAAPGHPAKVEDFVNEPGVGARGRIDGLEVTVARPSAMADGSLAGRAQEVEAEGRTVVAVAWESRTRALLMFEDSVRPSSADAVRTLRALGLRTILLSGDNRPTVEAVGRVVGVDDVIAEVLPAGKAAAIRDLQRAGRTVAMVGDGINDAPALAQADLGIAVGTGADVAIEASDLTLVGSDLRAVPLAIRLARRTLRTIQGNLVWAFAYNIAAVPLAAAGLLSPLLAAAAMAASSLFVVTNSLRLRRFAAG
ncbi:MAG TPA: cation-translocating P-type ATPase [Solirubrobacteraceae bacterium]